MNSENDNHTPSGFRPAPNPFEQSTADPADVSAPEATPEPIASGEVEMVGKRADEKPAAQQQAQEEAGKTEEKPKKRSLVASWLSPGTAKKPDAKAEQVGPKVPEQVMMSWQNTEFVQTHKPAGWYLGIAAVFAVLIIAAILTRQYVTVGLFSLMAVALVLISNRPPRTLVYRISNYGVQVGEKKYLFDDFGSYYETLDYGQPVLELVPNKRFGTLISMPPLPNQVEQVEETLSKMLPKVPNKEDYVDKLFRAMRF